MSELSDRTSRHWYCPPCGTFDGPISDGRCDVCAENGYGSYPDPLVPAVEVEPLREALHRICGLTHQDIDDPVTMKGMWRLVSRVHHVARAAVEPRDLDEEDGNA